MKLEDKKRETDRWADRVHHTWKNQAFEGFRCGEENKDDIESKNTMPEKGTP